MPAHSGIEVDNTRISKKHHIEVQLTGKLTEATRAEDIRVGETKEHIVLEDRGPIAVSTISPTTML